MAPIIAAIIAGIAAVLGVVVVQNVLDGQTTTTWSQGTIALSFILPIILAAAGMIGVLKMMGKL